MWPGFDSRSGRHMCVEFVVGSCPFSKGFSPGTITVFLPPQKTNISKFQFNLETVDGRATLWNPLKNSIFNMFSCRHTSIVLQVILVIKVFFEPPFPVTMTHLLTSHS